MTSGVRIGGLFRYPVKSMGGEALTDAVVDNLGLAGDRRWMLIDDTGRFLTQRELPRMATVHARLRGHNLQLTHCDDKLSVQPDDFSPKALDCQVWHDTVSGLPSRSAINQTLSDWLGVTCQLVQLAATTQRQVDRHFVPDGVHTGFADGFPVLVLSKASLDELNRRSGGHFDVRHFRPNILLDGCSPGAEDQWLAIHAGEVTVRLVKPCSRCVITTVDPKTGTRQGREPLATLATYRKQGNKVCFGQNGWLDLSRGETATDDQAMLRQRQEITVTPKE